VRLNPGVTVEKTTKRALLRLDNDRTIEVPRDAVFRTGREWHVLVDSPPFTGRPSRPLPDDLSPVVVIDVIEPGLVDLKRLRKHQPIDVVLFQACWVSNVETVSAIRKYANAMVASQTLLPVGDVDPWPYERLFEILTGSEPAERPGSVQMVERLVSALGQWHTDQRQQRPITGLDLREISVEGAFARLVQELVRMLPSGRKLSLQHLYSNAESTDRPKGLYQFGNTGLIDVQRLCTHLDENVTDEKVKQACGQLRDAIRKLVVAHATPHASLYRGVTVFYHPSQTIADQLQTRNRIWSNRSLEFNKATGWTKFGFEQLRA
jgi:hypothetical protein